MGKSLRGKECGKGICQRKDGLYSARFVSSEGKRQVKCFSSLPEARNWLEDAKYADRHEDVFAPPDMTASLSVESSSRAAETLTSMPKSRSIVSPGR